MPVREVSALRSDGDTGDGLASLERLQRLVDHMVAPVFVFDLTTRRGCFGNAAAAATMGASWPVLQDLLRGDLAELAGPEAAARIEQGLAALATGAVGSYQGERTYRDFNGVPVHAQHTVTRLDLCDGPPVAVAVVARRPVAGAVPQPDAAGGTVAPVLATVDHEWRVDTVAPDGESGLFGMCSGRLLGDRLHEHVHPEDGPALTAAFDQAPDGEAATTVRLRTMSGWRDVDVLAGALCRHQPHRVGVLLAARRASEASVEHPPQAGGPPIMDGETLSPQQREVVARLLRGENIASMAEAMRLSRSTIRNHLCAVYAKAGVHSQAELIAHVTGRHAVDPGSVHP